MVKVSHFCAVTLFILLGLLFSKLVYAAPMAGYIVNEQKKLCTIDIIGDERGDVNVGSCVIKIFKEDPNDYNPKKVCEANGYIFTKDSFQSFCSGKGVGLFINSNVNYNSLLKLFTTALPFILILLFLILFFIMYPKISVKGRKSIIIFFILFSLVFVFLFVYFNTVLITKL